MIDWYWYALFLAWVPGFFSVYSMLKCRRELRNKRAEMDLVIAALQHDRGIVRSYCTDRVTADD